MATDKVNPEQVSHLETSPAHDGVAIMAGDRTVTLDADDLRDQIAAQVKLHNLSFTSAASLQLFFYFFVAYCNSWGTGFDSSLMGAMNSNTAWHEDLNIPETGGKLGIVSAIYTVGNIAGSFFAGPLSDKWGRKWGMFIGSWIVIIGVIIMTTASGASAYMGGRFLGGLGVAVVRSSAPAYVTEISPPQWRGPATLLYNSLWIIGAVLASGVAYGTGPIKSSMSWKLPIILQVIPSTIVVLFVFFLPESPRWLIANDRHEEAVKLLAKYHASGDANSPLIMLEMAEMRASIRQNASDKRWYDYSELINTRSNRYRTFLNVSVAVIGQWGGNNLTGGYQANVLRSIGITAQSSLLAYNLGYYVVALVGAIIGSLICDLVGRRKLLMFGCIALAVCLAVLTGLIEQYHEDQPTPISDLTIVFIFLVGTFHSSAINPLVVAYPVEILHTNTRAKGMGVNNFVLNVAEFVNTYGTPIGLQNIGWCMFIIYAVWNVVQTLWIYFLFVETRHHTLEELDAIFESKTPVKESLKKFHKVEAIPIEQIKGV